MIPSDKMRERSSSARLAQEQAHAFIRKGGVCQNIIPTRRRYLSQVPRSGHVSTGHVPLATESKDHYRNKDIAQTASAILSPLVSAARQASWPLLAVVLGRSDPGASRSHSIGPGRLLPNLARLSVSSCGAMEDILREHAGRCRPPVGVGHIQVTFLLLIPSRSSTIDNKT